MGSLVTVVDDSNNRVEAGWWEHDGSYWRYVCPIELVPRLQFAAAAAAQQQAQFGTITDKATGETRQVPLRQLEDIINYQSPLDQRKALREKVSKLKPKAEKQATAAAVAPAGQLKCPNVTCDGYYDPSEDLLDCGECGESRCAKCMPDPVRPCADCQALKATPDEGGYDASAAGAAPPSGRLFDGQFHPDPKALAKAEAAGELPDDDDDND